MTRVEIPDARPRWTARRVVAWCAAAVVVAAAIVVWAWPSHEPVCDDQVGLTPVDGQCVGVADTDRVYDFGHEELRDVAVRLREANAGARQDDEHHVGIAVLLNLTPGDHAIEPPTQLRKQLEGALRAQAAHNEDRGHLPRVELLLANAGDGFEHWPKAVEELLRRRDTPDNLVAVTGFGQSLTKVTDAIRALAKEKVPMVASTLTSSTLQGIRGLLRPAPNNSQQAVVAAEKAAEIARGKLSRRGVPGTGSTAAPLPGASTGPEKPKAVIITDEKEGDPYPSDLKETFEVEFGRLGGQVADPLFYNSGLGEVSGTFRNHWLNICSEKAEVIYFAGRGLHLSAFVGALSDVYCDIAPDLVVLSGDDSPTEDQVAGKNFTEALDKGIEIINTELAPPDLWEALDLVRAKPEGSIPPDAMTDAGVERFLGPRDGASAAQPADDGEVLSYDAVFTATTLVQNAVEPDRKEAVTARDVWAVIDSIRDFTAVQGASGRLSYDTQGNAVRKTVFLMSRTAEGHELVDVR
ncbi:hypothetical protein Q5530_20105 [Saccharothrix sp. BKS2]|uniref:hypothetical protein n=1 Tax=Saccharothrix sp. BKS2 TaxID=3064400 RepID=UPI0039E982F0